MEGSQSKLDVRPAIAILEMPNAHTYRVRLISTTPASAFLLGARYSNGYEVLTETTTTFLATDGAFNEVITTVGARKGGSFKTVWYERVAKGGIGDRKYTWSSDLCHDVYGNPMFEEGEMCGPLTAIPVSGDGAVSDECKSWGKVAGGVGQAMCMVGIAYAGFQAAAGTAGLILASGGTAAPTAAGLLGALTSAAVGSGICSGVKEFAQGLGELACDWMSGAPASTPPPVGIELETGTGLSAESGCSEMGGTMYYGAVNVTTSGSCDDAENESSDGFLQLFNAADDVSEEVVVYGDPACEPTTSTVAPSGGLCIIVSG